MSSDNEQRNQGIVPAGNRGLTKYSSVLIQRGLDLAKELDQCEAGIEIHRQTTEIIKPQTWRCVHTLMGHSSWVTCVAITPDGETLVSGDNVGIIKLWHLQTGKLLYTLSVENSDWYLRREVIISPDGQILAYLTANTVKIYRLKTVELLHTFIHTNEVDDFCEAFFSPDGYSIATTAWIDFVFTLQIWNLHTKDLLRIHQGFPPIAISPDWQTFAKSGWGSAIEILNLQTREQVCTLSGGHSYSVESVAFSPDGKTFASGGSIGSDYDSDFDTRDHTVKIWNLHTGEMLQTLIHPEEINHLAFSPDGQTLVSIDGSKMSYTIRIWSLLAGELINTLDSYSVIPDFTFSPDGQNLLAVSYSQEIEIYHLSTGKLRCLITLENSDSVGRVAFSPDGQTLAVGCSDNTVMIWQLST